MRKITRLLVTAALLVAGVGGVKVYAGKLYWSPSTAIATWTSATNTMEWTSSDMFGYHVMYTGFTPAVQNNSTPIDYSSYTKLHFTLSSVSSGSKVQVKFVSDGKEEKLIDLTEGENNLYFANYSSDINFSAVKEISMWGAGTDGGSAVITNVYMQTVRNLVTCTGLGDEITSLSDITDGTKFVISDNGTNALFFSGDQDAQSAALALVPHNAYFYYTLTNIAGLDLDKDGNDDTDIYAINIIDESGTAFPAPYSLGNNVNFTNGGKVFSGSAQADKAKGYGTDAQYQGIWKVAYSDGNGFTFENCSLKKYLKVNGSQDAVCYLKLYESLNFEVNSEFDKEDNSANDAIFDLTDATGYNAETGEMTDGTWTFATPVDISNWDYLMITTVNNPSAASHEITITDDNGVSVGGENYSGGTAGTGGNMWLDRWNNQNAIRISIDYLRIYKGMDITKIKSLTINGTTKIANIYLTDYNNTKVSGGYKDGDEKREYSETGKFGTICLPYKASYAGAEVYSITGSNASSISLERVHGLLEAGKPYFYVSADESGQDNGGIVRNVNFFRADLEKYDVSAPVPNNGLIGTFNRIEGLTPGADIYILSSNKLYKVDSDVNVGANKAYIDKSQITNTTNTAGARSINLMFNEPTGINAVSAEGFTGNGEFYNLQGQRVSAPRKGLYIVNGKVIVIK